jgi:hypothetical protein
MTDQGFLEASTPDILLRRKYHLENVDITVTLTPFREEVSSACHML